nr:D-Glucosaminate-6-phosphate ammonia-lyase [Kibdelosporangium sp. MJ126-NF4]
MINASATLTALGGSILAPPVAAAMAAAAEHFVSLVELQEKVGDRLAELTGNEAGYVSCGAWAGTIQAVSACLRPGRDEVVVFPEQRLGYEEAVQFTGAQLSTEIGPRTACVLWYAGTRFGTRDLSSVLGKGVPVIVDAAAQIPPIATLWRFTVDMGADAVLVSGGKGLRGPQSTGLVLGRKHIVDGCRANGSPHHGVGRGMKVGKEELLGLLAAVEWNLEQDEDAAIAGYEQTVAMWLDGLRDCPGIRAVRGYPSEAGQPHSRALIHAGSKGLDLVAALRAHDPPIMVGLLDDETIALNPQTLQPGEAEVILDAVVCWAKTRG